MKVDLGGRVAVVTGAAGGIGQEIVHRLARAGVQVVATDRSFPRDSPAGEGQMPGATVHRVEANLLQQEDQERIVAAATTVFGRLDILINNAGCIVRRSALEATVAEWDLMMSVNLKAAFFLAQRAATHMRIGRWGRIVSLASQAGHTGGAVDCPIYAITKGGMITMTRALARAFAPDGITVNAVAPGIVMTEMITDTLSDEQVHALVRTIPIGRVSSAAEVADATLFLASDEAGSITGHVLDVNGGMLMR